MKADLRPSAPLFDTGHVIRTTGALLALMRAHVSECALLERHCGGDFGDIEEVRRQANAEAIQHGGAVVSRYAMAPLEHVLVVTDADRLMTTILLPSEYDQRFPSARRLPDIAASPPLLPSGT